MSGPCGWRVGLAEETGSSREVCPGDMHLPAWQQEPDQALAEELPEADLGKEGQSREEEEGEKDPAQPEARHGPVESDDAVRWPDMTELLLTALDIDPVFGPCPPGRITR